MLDKHATALDPAIVELAARARASAQRPLHRISPVEARDRVRAGNALCSGGTMPAWITEDTAGGVPVRVYAPDEVMDRTLVYFHGGGWVTGDLDYSDEVCRTVAKAARCTVVSVDYRLAPEYPFPAGLEDAKAVLDAVAGRTAAPVGVGGDSAGGNLAAVCALAARDEGRPIAFQLLVYPVLDHDQTRGSYISQADAFPIGRQEMEWFWKHYVPPDVDRGRPDLSPLRAMDHTGVARALVVTAGHDPLRDEGRAYAEHLTAAGVPAAVRNYPSLVHGFFRLTGAVPAARDALAELGRTVDDLFER